ncbi:MAG: peptide chain release factor N(5)-glutamine methyltransferase [bacterium]|nr:peptide chain release factor N(5)-glutamine methyltransferase [bacterium]
MKKNEFIDLMVKSGFDSIEAKAEVELILEFVLNKTKEELLFISDFNDEKIMPVIKERIETRRPIQYILGYAPFMGEKFIVDENVLIPRDETEILVREAFASLKKIKKETVKILDIGTGSGIIACMLGKLSDKSNINTEIIGIDISIGALNTAIENMKKMNLTRRVMFRKSDLFSNVHKDEKFDIIVSNPPYIPKALKETIQKEVEFEPYNALYTDDSTGLYFYEKIIKKAPEFLNDEGLLLFEMMKGQNSEIEKMMKQNGFSEIQTIKDLAGIERVIKGKI